MEEHKKRPTNDDFGQCLRKLRKQIEDFNTKLRLVKFFRDIEHVLLEENHQITFDEYIELLRLSSLEKDEDNIKV